MRDSGENMSEDLVRLEEWFRKYGGGGAVVAYSGGIDSTLVAYVANKILGHRALAVTFRHQFTDNYEVEEAVDVAKRIGLNHLVIDLALPEILMGNPHERCYICKKHIMGRLRELAKELRYELLIDGTNYDDLSEERPGIRALREEGVRSPLVELGIGKGGVRVLSRTLGLDYRKPSRPCLATRFPYGYRITYEELNRVSSAERLLKNEGFRVIRVRHLGAMAKIEVGEDEIQRLLQENTRRKVIEGLRALGYEVVALDLEGYRNRKGRIEKPQ